jgi:repressor LexA
MSTLGTRIKEAREQKSLLQSDLARLIGAKSSGVISNWEKDLSKPDANKIVKLCQALDVSASYLLDYFGDDDFEIMPHEIELIKNYRSLDNHGKEIVTLIIHKELQRCAASPSPDAPTSKDRADPSDRCASEVLKNIHDSEMKSAL